MATFPTTSGTKALTQNAEWSVAQNAAFNAATPKTTTGYVTVWLDFTAMVAGDTIQIRVYRSIGGGTLTSDEVANAVPGAIWTRNLGLVGGNWDISIKLTTATGRTIGFEVVQDNNDVAVASLAAAVITTASIADGAFTAAKFAAGALTSTVIAAGAIGAAQIADAAFIAAKFATDAFGATAFSAGAVTKIQSGLALASSALSTAVWTNGRAALIDNVDATVGSRAPSATALSTAQWTNARATAQDNLDATVSSRATAADVAAAVVAGTASLAADAADAVWSTISEGGETVMDTVRLLASRLFGPATVRDGDGTYDFFAKDGVKKRLSMTRSGTARTVVTRDGT